MPLQLRAFIASIAAFTLLALPVLATAQSAAADTVTRFRCTLVDGTVHVLLEDLRQRHPGMVETCDAVRVAAAPVRVEAPPDFAVWGRRTPSWLTVIQAPFLAGAATDARGPVRPMPAALAALVDAASQRHRLDPALVSALIFQESRYQSNARSPKGAMGLMQLMPATAAQYGVSAASDLLDPKINVDTGVRHLRSLHDRYEGRVDLMLAAYNAGEGAVKRYGNRIPPYRETQDYVREITARVGVPAPRE